MVEITIKRIDRNTMRNQILVYMDAFSHEGNEYKEIEAKWKIKHYDNPHGESYVFGAYDEDKLVGMNSFMPLSYQYREKTVNVVQSCESGVLKAYQRKGIWQQIMTYAERYFKEHTQFEAIIGFPNYENSYSGFLKMGYETLFFERNMIMICNGRTLAELVWGVNRWNGLARITEMQKSLFAITYRFAKEYCVEESVDRETTLVREDKIVLPVSQEIVEWKRYKQFLAYNVICKGKNVARFYGYEITRGQVKYFMLSKCFKVDKNAVEKYCWASIISFLGKKKYAFIRVWHNGFYQIPKLGFIEIKKHKNPFIIKLLQDDRGFLRNSSLWDVGILDLD